MKYQRRELIKEDYDTLLERQIRFEAKNALSKFDRSVNSISSDFNYRSYYIEQLKREYPFLRYDLFKLAISSAMAGRPKPSGTAPSPATPNPSA